MEVNNNTSGNCEKTDAFASLENAVYAALETYSNVHRGSGHHSMVSTHLYEQAREIILEYFGLNKNKYVVIFCTPGRAAFLKTQMESKNYQSISSHEIGLPLGIIALVVKKKALPKGAPFLTGGGTTRLISREWVTWAKAPDKFEAGTPSIINVIAFAKALKLTKQLGKDIFQESAIGKLTVDEILKQDELDKYTGQELLNKLRQTLIGRDILVPTRAGNKPYINFDNSASTPTFMPVWKTVCHTWCQSKQIQQEVVKEVRTICTGMLGASASNYDLIFTSNTTDAINLAAGSIFNEPEDATEAVILSSMLEHSSNDLPWRMINGASVIRLSINEEGLLNLKELEQLLSDYNLGCKYRKKRIIVVAVTGASNVLGICNNLSEISRIVHQYGARLLVDAAQLVAHRKVEIEKWGIDYLAFSAHKVYAPFGCGVLIAKKGLLKFNPGELDMITASGEANTGGIAALGKALVLLQRIGMDLIQKEEQALCRQALLGLGKVPGLKIYGIKDPASKEFSNKVGVIVFSLKAMMPNSLAKVLAERGGIGVRYGCHCAHVLIKHLLGVGPSLERFQRIIVGLFPNLRLPGVLRISFGIENSEEELDKLIHILHSIANKKQEVMDKNASALTGTASSFSKAAVKKQMKDFVNASAQRVYTSV